MERQPGKAQLSAGVKVALVHDWLTGMRGGERVLEEFIRLFPQGDIFTLVHQPGSVSDAISARRIIESPISRLPFGRSHFRAWLPLFPWAVEAFDLKGYQLVLSSSHCVAKGVIPPPDALHVSYVHTPMRYVWDMRGEYLGRMGAGGRAVAGWGAHYLRNWDASSSRRVDRFVANSNHVRKRILKYYRRDADVVHPPVDVAKFTIGHGGGGYYVTVSALVPYKRVDIAIEACERVGARLKVVGDGPEYARLRRLAGPMTEFTGPLTTAELADLYRDAVALIHSGEEDFGIAPLEAQACGRPVIAYGRGGALETVVAAGDAPTGVFFTEPEAESLAGVLRDFDPHRFRPADARANAERFTADRFRRQMMEVIDRAWDALQRGEPVE